MWKKYQVKKNDTICKIAKKFNMKPYCLCKTNDITNIDFIYEGMILIVNDRRIKSE